MKLPFTLETALEREIAADPEWQEGVVWGKPRTGHLEGPVMYHIAEIFANIERQGLDEEERKKLRLITLVHDSFKYQVNELKPKVGKNHHGYLARTFAERYIDNSTILDIIEWHDEAYNSWRMGVYKGKWQQAEERMEVLLQRIGKALPLYVYFFNVDSMTASKNQEPVHWFREYLKRKGIDIEGTISK